MNLKLLFACSMLSIGVLTATADTPGVVVIRTDGTTHTVDFGSLHRIDIGTDAVTVHHTAADPVTHSMADIKRIDIGVDVAGIADITADGSIAVWPTVVNDVLNIAGATDAQTVSVYSLAGVKVAAAPLSDGKATINTSALTPGTYVVAVGQHTVKIAKK